MIFLNAMPFYYLGRGERNPHSLQQPRGYTYTREVLSLTPPRRRTRLQERCRQNFRLVIHRFHVHAINLSVYLDTGSGNHRRLLNVSERAESLGEEYCATLLGFCTFCGEYFTKQYCITLYFRGRKISRKVNLKYFREKIFSRIYCSRENIFPRKYLPAKISSRENILSRK